MKARLFQALCFLAASAMAVPFAGCRAKPIVVPAEPAAQPPALPAPEPTPAPPPAVEAEAAAILQREQWPRLFLSPAQVPPRDLRLSESGLAITSEEYHAGLRRFAQTYQGNIANLDAEYERYLREQLLLIDFLRNYTVRRNPEFEPRARSAMRELLSRMVIEDEVAAITATPEEVRAQYEKDLEIYTRPRQVSVRIMRVATATEADSVMRRLESGEDFSEVAHGTSNYTSSSGTGDLETFTRGKYRLIPQLEDLAFELKTAEVRQFATAGGIYVIRKEAERPETVEPFESVRERVSQDLLARKRATAREQFLQRLREPVTQP